MWFSGLDLGTILISRVLGLVLSMVYLVIELSMISHGAPQNHLLRMVRYLSAAQAIRLPPPQSQMIEPCLVCEIQPECPRRSLPTPKARSHSVRMLTAVRCNTVRRQ